MKRNVMLILSVCTVQALYSSDQSVENPSERVVTSTSPVLSESPEAASSPLEEGVTEGVLALVGRCKQCLIDLDQEAQLLTTIGKKMERVRVVRQALVKNDRFVGRCAALIKNVTTQQSAIALTRKGDSSYNYNLTLLSEDESLELCQVLTEYLNPSSKSTGEQKIRELIGLRREASFNPETLKSLLAEMRDSIPRELSVAVGRAEALLDQVDALQK